MDDKDVALPAHVTLRNGVYQYVRRVPDDVMHAFGARRIQRSLRTRMPSEARLRAAHVDAEIERQLTEARAKRGVVTRTVISEAWTWPDWEQFVAWFKSTLIEEDTAARLGKLKGRQLTPTSRRGPAIWLDDNLLRQRLDLQRHLEQLSVADYCQERFAFVQAYGRRLGVSITSALPSFQRIMSACLKAELEVLELVAMREGGNWVEHDHPDTISGPWRQAAVDAAPIVEEASPAIDRSTMGGTRLAKMVNEWIDERGRLKKRVDQHLVADMRNTVGRFVELTNQAEIGSIERRHVIAFRDKLVDSGEYKTATINKKVGFITTLLALAAGKGWIESAIAGGIYIDVPVDEDNREPYSRDELREIFSHAIFTQGFRFDQVKACQELQFWLPLISVTHGLSSSEILQIGPDTVRKHPDADILCLQVTTAGGRSIKTFARQRYIPIRHELLDLGLATLVEKAQRDGASALWSALRQPDWTVSKASNYFSAFWSMAQRDVFMIQNPDTSLYSLRHAFKDALDRAKTPLEVKQALMGHIDPGTTGRYGSKRKPRDVDIQRLNRTIQKLDWPFLKSVSLQ